MCLSDCSKCQYLDHNPYHLGDIVCGVNPAYASMWKRLKSLDKFSLDCLPIDDCRDFGLDPSLQSKAIALYLSFNSWQTLARESSNPFISNALADLLIHLELSLTLEQWQTIANTNTDPVISWCLEAQGFKSQNPWIEVDSSCIDAIAYVQSNSMLKIRFNRGETYEYDCVPHQLYLDLLNANSHGRFFNRYIKDVFAYRAISL